MIPKYVYMREVVERTGVKEAEILSRSRENRVKRARLILWQALRLDGYSYPAIGRFTNRDHTTVMYLLKRSPDICKIRGEEVFAKVALDIELPPPPPEYEEVLVPDYKQNKIVKIQRPIKNQKKMKKM